MSIFHVAAEVSLWAPPWTIFSGSSLSLKGTKAAGLTPSDGYLVEALAPKDDSDVGLDLSG